MKPRFLLLLTFALFLFCISVANAQTNPNIENGLKPFGSYDGTDIDSVDLFTGNLTVHIPLFAYPQRGTLKNEFVMVENGKMFKVFQNCNHVTGVCNDRWTTNLGGNFTFPLGVTIRGTSQLGAYWTFNSLYQYIYTTTTWDGAVHQMALNTADHTTYESIDNSGIWNSGTRVSPILYGIAKRGNGDQATLDTNGNFFSSTADTIGRAFPTSGGAGDTSGCGGDLTGIQGSTITKLSWAKWRVDSS